MYIFNCDYLLFIMRVVGLSVYCFALSSLNKVDTYIHQSKKCANLTQAGCHGKQGDN